VRGFSGRCQSGIRVDQHGLLVSLVVLVGELARGSLYDGVAGLRDDLPGVVCALVLLLAAIGDWGFDNGRA